jgi:hypothetical protein
MEVFTDAPNGHKIPETIVVVVGAAELLNCKTAVVVVAAAFLRPAFASQAI